MIEIPEQLLFVEEEHLKALNATTTWWAANIF